jgi:dinuclear metal center YbgI/SA1388 family protein
MKIEVLTEYIRTRLRLDDFLDSDVSMNGLQVGRPDKEVHKIVCAVDASLATFQKAAELGADAVFVHHGLFWGKPLAITSMHYERIALLVNHDIALLAAHLPLDAHSELGNNSTMAKKLHLSQIESFGKYHGSYIGFRGVLPKPVTADEIADTLGFSVETGLHILPFGKKLIETVGIISGGAPYEVQEAIELGLDAYITGETSHTMFATCKESGITMISGGHYATEVFGVQQMAKCFIEELQLEASFVALPTAL